MVASIQDKIVVAGMAANEKTLLKVTSENMKILHFTYKHNLTTIRNCSLRNCTVCVHVTWLSSSISCWIVYGRRSCPKAIFVRNLHWWCNGKPVHGFGFYASLNWFSLNKTGFVKSLFVLASNMILYLKFFDHFA